ncbi:Tyrosine-protein kinase Fer [Schistosoma japonicum]|nr:Tyrosine-protein kinase Fer [Schistosoma japonicum]
MGNHTVNETNNYLEHDSDAEDNINTLASTATHITDNNHSILVSSPSETLSVPPLPPHNPGNDKSMSSSSISTPGVDNINTKRYTDSLMLRSDLKEASQVITSAIDAQMKSINEMLCYFSKLVKAEKTVQQALSGLLDDQMESTRVGIGSQRSTTTTVRNLFKANYSRGYRRRLTANILNKNLSNSPTDGELNKLLQNLVISTNHQVRMYSTRALFHKLITAGQLDSLNNCEQCLKRTYLECEEELKSQARQYTLSLKAYEKKYLKFIGQLSNIQSKLANLCDKRLINNRKIVDGLMNTLEYSTKKLHLLHNEYCLTLITANHYQQWLFTHLRPCLLKGVERTMQLASEVVWHLLVFGGEDIHHFQSNWLKEFQSELDLTSLLEQNGVQFPGPVQHTFNQALNNASLSGNLSPGSLIVNDLTGQSLIELAQLHKNKELLHRETVNQMTKECLQWEEALSQWHAVFANPGPNPWLNLINTHSSTVSSSPDNNALNGFHHVDNTNHLVLPDIQDLWHDDRARPVNLCEVSFRLAICEFELCFANCLADSEAQLVNVLTDAQCRLNWLSLKLLPTTDSFIDGAYPNTPVTFSHDHCTTLNGNNVNSIDNTGDIDMQNGIDDNCSQGLNGHDNSIPFCDLGDSCSVDPKLIEEIPNSPFALSTSNTSDISSSMEHQQQQQQQRPERNRLWQSVRQSMSKFRSHFIRNNNIRSSTSALPNTRAYQCRLRETIVTGIPLSATVNEQMNHNNNTNQLTNTYFHMQSMKYGKQLYNPTTMNGLSNQQPVGINATFHRPNQQLDHQSNIQSNRESQDSTSILTSFPIVDECEADINKEPWFHGVLPRAEVERLLQNQGDFLVRQTSKRASGRDTLAHWNGTKDDLINGNSNEVVSNKDVNLDGTVLRMVLSVFWHGHRHFILYGGPESGEGWHLEDGHFPTIRELIEYHMKTQTPVTAKSGACLITPISRPDWELDNRDVQLLQKIGQGNFGDVYRGVYNGCEVAVKTCRVDMTASDLRRKFLQGETTALNFNHPNIVKLVGIAVQSYPIMIVMEYVPGGSLLSHLRKSKNALPVMKLLQMSLDAACGMMYLEARNCIHRDLAARNCLISNDGQLKIADFGMSREEHIYELSDKRGQIPIKWTAPEALRTGRYTIKCDVWSYGVLLWEIFTFGDVPYRNWSNQQTRDMIESGYRLPAPDLMPVWLRTIMNHCWHDEPLNRPSFLKISQEIKIPNINSFTPNLNRSTDNSQLRQMKSCNTPTIVPICIKDKRIRES